MWVVWVWLLQLRYPAYPYGNARNDILWSRIGSLFGSELFGSQLEACTTHGGDQICKGAAQNHGGSATAYSAKPTYFQEHH